jgi:hypothetical protein
MVRRPRGLAPGEEVEVLETTELPSQYARAATGDFELHPASSTHRAHALTDGDLSSSWQSSARCPHSIRIAMVKPMPLEFVAVYTALGDGSFTPKVLSLRVMYKGGSAEHKFPLPKTTGWAMLPIEKAGVVSELHLSVDENRQGVFEPNTRLCLCLWLSD